MAPFITDIQGALGHWGSYIVYLIIGFAFGYVLEIAGFGKSTKLAAQFYFREMTVLKVMFGAIIVAMVLIFLTSGLGLLDYNLVYVNPTYLWPGILGGLIMGFGFIIGGFCPGTSMVSAATLKIDGIVFVLGVFFGIFLFGETVSSYEDFWYSSYLGRFTLPQLFNVSTGVIVLAVVLMALAAFFLSEIGERVIGKMDTSKEPKWRYGAAGGLVVLSVATIIIGQPTNADRWARLAPEKEQLIADRQVQIHPAELLHYLDDRTIITVMLDVRSESDYNAFHIRDAEHVPLDSVQSIASELNLKPANAIFVVMSNDETAATQAWRTLVAESVPNVYILEGGINNWLDTFSVEGSRSPTQLASHADDQLAYSFPVALGARYDAASPNPDVFKIEYTPRVKLQLKRGPTTGGCG